MNTQQQKVNSPNRSLCFMMNDLSGLKVTNTAPITKLFCVTNQIVTLGA